MTMLELCKKDVIQLEKGVKLGRADDLRFDSSGAVLEGIILFGRPRLFGILGRQQDVFIPWGEIERIGADVILVNTPLPPRPARTERLLEKMEPEQPGTYK